MQQASNSNSSTALKLLLQAHSKLNLLMRADAAAIVGNEARMVRSTSTSMEVNYSYMKREREREGGKEPGGTTPTKHKADTTPPPPAATC